MFKNIFIHFILLLFLVSCNSNKSAEQKTSEVQVLETDLELHSDIIDSTPVIEEKSLPENVRKITEHPEMKEIKKKLEQKFGVQWDFCTCVIKNDSILEAFNTASDEDFEKIMKRSDYIDSKCSMIRSTPNTTPEERAKHENAVRTCRRTYKNK